MDPTNTKPIAARTGWALLIAATLYVCYFSQLGALGFVGPDEPRYAWVARDMAETGDWVTPRLYGKPWFEKPVLYYWGAAVSFKVFGVSEAAARLPSAVSALLATLALAWLAWRLHGVETARWVLLLLPTTVGMIGFSHAAATDMPFSGMLTIAMVAAAVILRIEVKDVKEEKEVKDKTVWLAVIGFGVFLGLAVLAKGPAAIVLCGGAVFFWALFTRRWRDAFRLLHPVAIVTFCVTALPWYLLCARRNPDFFRVFIIEHNFQRYLTPEFRHVQPFWFYGPILFIALIPWILIALNAAVQLARSGQEAWDSRLKLFVICWGAFPLVFFSLSKSKLPGYILPAIPPLIFLSAHGLANSFNWTKRRGMRDFAVIAMVPISLVLAIALSFHFTWKSSQPREFLLASGILVFATLNACILLAWAHKRDLLTIAAILNCVLFLGIVNHLFLPWIDPILSPRVVAEKLERQRDISDRVVTFRLRRGFEYALNFYLGRETAKWDAGVRLPAYAIVSADGIAELKSRGNHYRILDRSCLDALLIEIDSPSTDGHESVK